MESRKKQTKQSGACNAVLVTTRKKEQTKSGHVSLKLKCTQCKFRVNLEEPLTNEAMVSGLSKKLLWAADVLCSECDNPMRLIRVTLSFK